MTIGVVHPGEMGATVGAALVGAGHTVLMASAGRSRASAERGAAAGLEDVATIEELAARSDVVIALCPPHAARELAGSFAEFSGLYVDANAISPATARAVADVVGRCVDGGVIGPPPRAAGTTRLYLSGAEAEAVAALFTDTVVDARVVSGRIGAASAVKMAYAAWTKGTAALALATRAAARAEGIEDPLLAEWELSLPQLAARTESAAGSALDKGWRWVGEMEEIAATFADAGLPDGFHLAAAEIYARCSREDANADEQAIERVLAALARPPAAGQHPPLRRYPPPAPP